MRVPAPSATTDERPGFVRTWLWSLVLLVSVFAVTTVVVQLAAVGAIYAPPTHFVPDLMALLAQALVVTLLVRKSWR